ncbi:MAG: carbohydrate ABC transporter permease [Thermomicrobiales bacterium]
MAVRQMDPRETAWRPARLARRFSPRPASRLVLLSYLLLGLGSVATLFPFAWMISTSLKANQYVMQVPPQWIPDPIVWRNYVDIWDLVPLASGFRNSATVAVLGTIGVLFASSLAGFAFAKLDFPGRNVLFMVTLSTMMLPDAVLLVPQFILFRELGWIDTLRPLIVPSFFGAAFETFFFRQYFRTIPDDLIDAAEVDGASFFHIYRAIVLPLSGPVLITLGLFAFMWRWNDYMGPLIYLHHPEKQTLPVLISTFQSQYTSDFPRMMAVAVLSILPIIILFFLMQRRFIEGIALTGMKG